PRREVEDLPAALDQAHQGDRRAVRLSVRILLLQDLQKADGHDARRVPRQQSGLRPLRAAAPPHLQQPSTPPPPPVGALNARRFPSPTNAWNACATTSAQSKSPPTPRGCNCCKPRKPSWTASPRRPATGLSRGITSGPRNTNCEKTACATTPTPATRRPSPTA